MRDLHNNVKAVVALSPESAFTDDGTYVGPIIDRYGYQSVEFFIQAGKLLDAGATFAVTLEHGDNAALSDAAAPASTELLGSLPSFDQSEDDTVEKVGYIGKKRYLRVTITPTGNQAEAFFSGLALLSHANDTSRIF